jgi:hypothetical protein
MTKDKSGPEMGALTAKQIFYEWFSIFKTGQQLAQ